jgi:hypothetical protein
MNHQVEPPLCVYVPMIVFVWGQAVEVCVGIGAAMQGDSRGNVGPQWSFSMVRKLVVK